MTISQRRYVDITSGVGAGAPVARRELILRLFTTSDDQPTDSVVEFTSAADVGEYYGTGSPEFRRAAFYFGFTSKTTTRPKRISFGRWAKEAEAARIYATSAATVAALNAITAGSFVATIGTSTQTVTALDFSSDTTFSEIAAEIQVRIRMLTGSQFASATVTYNAIRNRFEFVSGETGAAPIAVTAATTNDASVMIGINPDSEGVQFSAGADAQTVTEVLTRSAEISNNFGSFAFVETLTAEQITEAATWNDAENVLYQYHVGVLPADSEAVSAALIGLSGTGITLLNASLDEFPELLPSAILASTDYSRRAGVMNYMFNSASLTPSVTTNAAADLYDSQRVNYYGETQTAGQLRRFYQRGVLTGTAADPVDMNVYANEQWLKDDAAANILALLLGQPRVSANQNGRGQVLSILQGTVNRALFNGSISVGSPINDQQRIFITEQAGDELAYQQVQTSGYWIDADIESFTTSDSRTEFRVDYQLIYAKDNAIRKVEGTHTLI